MSSVTSCGEPGTSRFDAVFFDFGGTLFSYVPFRQRFQQLLEDTARDHGIDLGPGEIRRRYAAASAQVGETYLERPSYLHRDLFGDIGEAFVRSLGAEPAKNLRKLFYLGQTRVAEPLIAPRDDAFDALERLHRAGVHVGVVSNIDDDQFEALWRAAGFHRTPTVASITTSEAARSCKPDPGIYHEALRAAGSPEIERCLFVGDSPSHDVVGARLVGMATALLVEPGTEVDAHRLPGPPEWVVTSLSEVADLSLSRADADRR